MNTEALKNNLIENSTAQGLDEMIALAREVRAGFARINAHLEEIITMGEQYAAAA